MKNTIYKFIFLLIPLAILLNMSNRGDFWKNKYDPEYCYLLNGANLAYEYGNIGLYQHPGATVHITTSVIIKATYALRSTENNLRDDVLLNPELYLKVIAWTYSIFNCLLLLILGLVVYKLSNEIVYGLLFQSSAILSITTIDNGFYRVSPEPLLFGAGVLLILLFTVKFYFNKSWGNISIKYNSIGKERVFVDLDVLVILLAIILGFSFATKINSIPLIILPFIFVSMRNKVFFLGFLVISFFFFTIPIWSHYKDLLKWVQDLFTHSGNYGAGEKKIVDLQSFSLNFTRFIRYEPVLFGSMLVSLFFVVKLYIQKQRDKHFKILLGLLLSQVFIVLLVLKHFEFRYFLPAFPTIVLNLFVILQLVNLSKRKKQYLVGSFIVMCFLINNFYRAKEYEINSPSIEKKSVNIYSTGCSSPIYALKFGDEFANYANADALDKNYGKQYFYNIWDRTFTGWKSTLDTIELKELYAKKVYFYGYESFLQNYKPLFKLKRISKEKYVFAASYSKTRWYTNDTTNATY